MAQLLQGRLRLLVLVQLLHQVGVAVAKPEIFQIVCVNYAVNEEDLLIGRSWTAPGSLPFIPVVCKCTKRTG